MSRFASFLVFCLMLASLALATAAAGAAPEEEDRAVCAVCGPREGSSFEPVRATATYRGIAYSFCSLQCKVDFLKNPQEFLASEVGTAAPTFELPKLPGPGGVSLEGLAGQFVLLDFWATFCAPCVKALPRLQALHARHAGAGFTVLGLLVDDKPELAQKLAAKAGVRYPLVRADATVWGAYRVNALPSLVLVGRDGRILKRFGGEGEEGAIEAEVEKALARPEAEVSK